MTRPLVDKTVSIGNIEVNLRNLNSLGGFERNLCADSLNLYHTYATGQQTELTRGGIAKINDAAAAKGTTVGHTHSDLTAVT